jgi:uncharacterized glyoxalase superfamily protein PhnB
MNDKSNPFGLHTITPYLIVNDVSKLIEFLTALLGATLRGEPRAREDGSVMHAEVQIGDSVVMMGEPTAEHNAMPGAFYTYVTDCDKSYALALELGATSVLEPSDFPHGDRYGGVEDLAGNTWWLVTHVGQ